MIGVLGGIASGKSLAARRLAGADGVVLDADRMAREVLEEPDVVRRIAERFGPSAIGPDGRPVREELARRVFESPADRKALESWTHPAVRARISAEIAAARAAGTSPIVLDVPLLLENDARHGFARECDVLVYVDADDDQRRRRARETRGWEPGEIERREAAQLPLEEKRARASYVISNRTSVRDLERECAELRRELGLD